MIVGEWNPSYALGIQVIDEQHQKLIEIIARLKDSMHEGLSEQALMEILGELVEYTKYHFSTEEKLFKKYHWSSAKKHTQEHEKFIKKVEGFLTKSDNRDQTQFGMGIELLSFLNNWLINHIKVSDRAYVSFLIPKMEDDEI